MAILGMCGWCEGDSNNQIFKVFVRAVLIYPVGSLIRCVNGQLGVVTDVSNGALGDS